MRVVQQRGRRRCEEPLRRGRRCGGCAPTLAHAAKPILESTRIRSACRRRNDFTGRGFGLTRLREAP
jgi:hypothetical protein